ncbi:response regulator [Marinomonas epiphytica]
MIKVLLVDDHEMLSHSLSHFLQTADGVDVVGTVASGEEAIEQTRSLQPDVVFMDVHMPGIGGLGATQEIKRLFPNTKVIALSALNDSLYPTQLLQAGASGYVTKGTPPDELFEAIKTVMAGERFISNDVARSMALSKVSEDQQGGILEPLSTREVQVAQMIVDGEKMRDIADKLNVSPKTVSTFKTRIFSKLNIDNDVALVRLATRYKILGMK